MIHFFFKGGEVFDVTGTVSAIVGDETITRSATMKCTVAKRGPKARIRGDKKSQRKTNQRVVIASASRDLDNRYTE